MQSEADKIPCKCPACVAFFTAGQLYTSGYFNTSAGDDLINNPTWPHSSYAVTDISTQSRSLTPTLSSSRPSSPSSPTSAATPHTKRRSKGPYTKSEHQKAKEAARLAAMDDKTREQTIQASERAKARARAKKAAAEAADTSTQILPTVTRDAIASSEALAAGSMIEQGDEEGTGESG